MDYSEPLTRLEKLPSLISDCFRRGDKESAYLYLEEVKERVSELQGWIRLEQHGADVKWAIERCLIRSQ